MLAEPIRQFIEQLPFVFVATADPSGQTHVAVGEHVAVSGDSLLVFENWFCPVTLRNILENAHVSVVATRPDTGNGYQMIGSIVKSSSAVIPDGYDPIIHIPETPQVLTRFAVRIEQVFEFTSGIHTDIPIT